MSASQSPAPFRQPPPPKRKSSALDLNEKPQRATKRRASKACQSCRTRKVRCNVVEHGPPCTNCRLDEIECVVTESKRKRRQIPKTEDQLQEISAAAHLQRARERITRGPLDGIDNLQSLASQQGSRFSEPNEHMPHSLYRTIGNRGANEDSISRPPIVATNSAPDVTRGIDPSRGGSVFTGLRRLSPVQTVPSYLKPIPIRMAADEVEYLQKKGALSIPETWFRNELCRAYVEFVHPYMPLLNVNEFLETLQKGDGSTGKVSLLLFQAIMFAGSAFVDPDSFKKAGFVTRKDMRKAFFQRVRLLYDFDYDIDRFSQVQTLLLMTSWYETTDDKKDAWHWMGIAIATSYTIGLHRNPARSNMEQAQQRQWKRVWWACVIRDRLIALGARRPIRIKPEDCDVPMLSLSDFEFGVLSEDIQFMSTDCKVVRDVPIQMALATMCIEKAKLCMCISEVLTSQYSLQKFTNGTSGYDMRTASLLSPKALDADSESIMICHQDLEAWANQLPDELKPSAKTGSKSNVSRGDAPLVVQRKLLHLIYYATLSALHRPQVLHNVPAMNKAENGEMSALSRDNLRRAALETTKAAKTLLDLDLVQYLPSTGVSVMQPAIISHLLDLKSPDEDIRRTALRGFCQCIQVMEKLRDCYTAADHSIALVEAAVRRADIKIPVQDGTPSDSSESSGDYSEQTATTTEDLLGAGRRESLVPLSETPQQLASTPLSQSTHESELPKSAGTLELPSLPTNVDIARKLEVYLASTPLYEQPQSVPGVDYLTCVPVGHYASEADFDAFLDFSEGDANAGEWEEQSQGMRDPQFISNYGGTPQAFSQYTQPNTEMMFSEGSNIAASPNMSIAGVGDSASPATTAPAPSDDISAITSQGADTLVNAKSGGGISDMNQLPRMSVAVPA